MQKAFAIAAIAAAVQAAPGARRGNKQDKKFAEHCAKWNTRVGDTADFDKKQVLYHATDEKVRAQNQKADASGDPDALRLAHNMFSTMDDEEKKGWIGGFKGDNVPGGISKLPWGKSKGKKGRGLSAATG